MNNWFLLPTRNTLALTRRALETALAQDIPNLSVLCWDDGSSDGTPNYLNSLDNVKTMLSPYPRGVTVAWNRMLQYVFEVENAAHALVVNSDVELRPHTYRALLSTGLPFVTAVGVKEWPRTVTRWGTEAYHEAHDRVKVGQFTERGIDIRGVVHIGANDGYEVKWYRQLGAERVLAFEPLPAACERFRINYSSDANIHLVESACGSGDGEAVLHVVKGDGQGSSLLPEVEDLPPDFKQLVHPAPKEGDIRVPITRLDTWFNAHTDFSPSWYNCLVVDVQGYELETLKGAEAVLHLFDCLNIECSSLPIYEGEAPAAEVIAWLGARGFTPLNPAEEHDDILFVRTESDPLRRLSPHPDFSNFLIRREVWQQVGPFDERFVYFGQDWDYHVRMHKAGITAYCADIPYLHHVSGTLKNVPIGERRVIQARAEQDREAFHSKWGFRGGTEEYYSFFSRASA